MMGGGGGRVGHQDTMAVRGGGGDRVGHQGCEERW